MIKISILKKIKFFHIIKSYFCFKTNRTQLINICNKIVNQDLCVESILGRLYELEKLNSLFSRKKLSKLNLLTIKKFETISHYINEIYKETKSKINNKNGIDKSKNDNIINK